MKRSPVLLAPLAALVVVAVVINALDPSYEPYYTTFSTLVCVQVVALSAGWVEIHHADDPAVTTMARSLFFMAFALSLVATVQGGRDLGHCLETTEDDRHSANECIDLYSSYAALDGPHGVENACVKLGKPVASVLGGVCLNVEHGGDTGVFLLVLQAIVPALALILNGVLMSAQSPDPDGGSVQNALVGVSVEKKAKAKNEGTKGTQAVPAPGIAKRAGLTTRLMGMRSVYYSPSK